MVFTIGFLAIILTGTLLLTLPFSSADGTFTNPIDAAFTAVSATCVTGLITVDTATHWNAFGHGVIITLIQIGGLGFMTVTVMLSLIIRRRVTPKERMLVSMSYNLEDFGDTMHLLRRIVLGTFLVETLGAAALATRFVPDYGWELGIRKSFFHSISAFCNAGFDTLGVGNPEITSLTYYVADPVVNFTLSFLIIFGGIGFLVWGDLFNLVFRRRRLSAYARFVLLITAILLFGGTLLFAIFEWNNPLTLDQLPFFQKLQTAFFQSSSWRTAGFSMFSNGDFTQASQLLGIVLMFIGGASGSTAGGVKVVTLGILVYTVFCVFIGRKQVVIFGRRISDNSFVRAVSVVIIQLIVIFLGTLLILATTDFPLIDVLYEVVSAISTVGLSTGITPQLSVVAKLTTMTLMYFGRLGVLTVSYAVLNSLTHNDDAVEYPEAKMLIG